MTRNGHTKMTSFPLLNRPSLYLKLALGLSHQKTTPPRHRLYLPHMA
jgi:hypothetical protein